MFGVGVAFYVDVCIVFKHRLNILPYPTWGWCLGIASSLVWLLAAGLWLGEHMVILHLPSDAQLMPHPPAGMTVECGSRLLAAQLHLRLPG